MQILIYHGPGQRIDSWLTSQFPYSRNFFQHIFERKGVTVISAKSNEKIAIGLKVKKSYRLQEGDQVHIESLERFLDGGILDECPALTIETWKDEKRETGDISYLSIILEKDDYMVIYKPKGILSHPNSVRDVNNPSVVGGLYHYFKTQGTLPTSGTFMRAGLVHRLDKETDGLMIIAKTEKGLTHFKQLFQQKSLAETIEAKEQVPLKKYYRAVCEVTEQGKAFLEAIHDKLPHIIQEDVVPKTPHPVVKEGITKIMSYRHAALDAASPDTRSGLSSGGCIIIELEILTGRTHQIRYHLSKYGLPIVGDYLYGTEDELSMQLTAYTLTYQDLQGIQQTVSLAD